MCKLIDKDYEVIETTIQQLKDSNPTHLEVKWVGSVKAKGDHDADYEVTYEMHNAFYLKRIRVTYDEEGKVGSFVLHNKKLITL